MKQIIIALSILPLFSFAQGSLTICNNFDDPDFLIYLDSTSNWEIGDPSTAFLNSSYESPYSIVTDLDSVYRNLDTSFFYAVLKEEWGGIPDYLDGWPSPLEIEMVHRFDLGTIGDRGMIEMSLDNGNSWYDVLSGQHGLDWGVPAYQNLHIFEMTGDTILDSLSVVGNSGGWVSSRLFMDIPNITLDYNPGSIDSLILRFSLISDSLLVGEGWQIDDLCLEMDYVSEISEEIINHRLILYPNPNFGKFRMSNTIKNNGKLDIRDTQGKLVYQQNLKAPNSELISAELPPGLYFVTISGSNYLQSAKMFVE